MKTKFFCILFMVLVVSASGWAQTPQAAQISINNQTGQINVPTLPAGVVPNFTSLKVGGVSLSSPDWSGITGKPTTLSGYGITDPVVLTSGSYNSPSWITGLAWSKITGTPTSLSGYGIADPVVLTNTTYANPAWLTSLAWTKITGVPTTLSGYGITDPVVLSSGSYSNPAWITTLGWSKITGAPTTLAGFGITDGINSTSAGQTVVAPFNTGDGLGDSVAITAFGFQVKNGANVVSYQPIDPPSASATVTLPLSGTILTDASSLAWANLTGVPGTITTLSTATESAHLVYIGPSSGSAVAPNFRALVEADLPATSLFTDGAQTITAVKTYASGAGATFNSGSTLTVNGTVSGSTFGAMAFKASTAETDLNLSDVTTANVSTTKHGLVPKAPNDAGKFLDGTGVYSTPGGSAPIISVLTESDKLARTGDAVGQRVLVTFNGHGRALYRYEGGGESSSGNWSLQGDIDVWRSTPDTTSLTASNFGTTLTDDADLQIDYIPPGTYDCEVSFGGFVDAGGVSWCVATSGSMASKPPGVYVWSNALSDSGFVIGDIFSAHSRTFGGSTDHFWAKETIVVTSGNLRVQFAQYSSNAADTNINAGARLHLHPAGN